ncbi:hypothetical protein QL285_067953 [Trifolium repens]|nr:hypothetical protein QL285_067953 [Trifolium repens]
MVKSLTTENHIPEDLVVLSILSKLPLKSLKRFGCLNKTCSLLFQNPNFMSIYRNNFISNDRCHSYYNDTSVFLHQEHYSHSHNNKMYSSLHSLSGKRFENREKLINLPTPFHEEDPRFYILGCGHAIGILCLYLKNTIVLWNPTTYESHVVPPSSIETPNHLYARFLVCLNGFGYDHVRDDYKIIRYIDFHPVPLWEIYSLRCNSWKKLDVNMPPCPWHAEQGERLYLDGICHWWSETWSVNQDDRYPHDHYLVSYDLTNDKVFTTLLPLAILTNLDANFDVDLVSKYLLILNGSIAVISWYNASRGFEDETTFHISILGELGVTESWTKLFIVGPLPYIDSAFGAGKNGDIFFRNNNNELVCFDLSTQIIEELGVEGESENTIVLCKKSRLSIGAISH